MAALRRAEGRLPGPAPAFQRLLALAPRLGAQVIREPRYGLAAQIVFPNGVHRTLRKFSLDVNPVASSELASDKEWAAYFMRRLGYPALEGEPFYSPQWCRTLGSRRDLAAAARYADVLGYPVIVKPNSRSMGIGVCKVETRTELARAARAIFKVDHVLLVQRFAEGSDHRLVVLDGQVLCAYERVPLSVVGDGRHTIRALLKRKQAEFVRRGRPETIDIADMRVGWRLRRAGLMLGSVPRRGERVQLLDNANLSSGGEAHDVTERLHPGYRRLARELTRDMGLRLCGLDLLTLDDIGDPPLRYSIVEINARPGIDYYASSGPRERRRVDAFYLAILRALERRVPC